MTTVDLVFVVLGLAMATALVARKLPAPPPVTYAVVGLAAGIGWHGLGFPVLAIRPELVLLLFLPPLLTRAAYGLPFRAFRRNLAPIGLLAVGLVLATMCAVAVVAHYAGAMPWTSAFVLGAIVAPPDPVAATSVASDLGLRHRLVVILEGEGLINDAIAIVAYGVAVHAGVVGHFEWSDAIAAAFREAPLGVAIGVFAGLGARLLRRRLDSVPLEVGISLLTPFVAYHVADRIGGSGVLAVVTLGFLLRRYAGEIASPAARLASRTVWGAIGYIGTGLVFLLLGLLVGEFATEVPGWPVVRTGLLVTLAAIVLRLAWMHVVPGLVRARRPRHPFTRPAERTVLGWAGMRGVVSLALALALPAAFDPAGGSRQAILFATLVLIVGTLVLQGATLVPLVRALGVGNPRQASRDERRARALARRQALAQLRCDPCAAGDDALADEFAHGRLGVAAQAEAGRRGGEALARALDAQRAAIARLRNDGKLGETVAERLESEIDIDEMGARGESGRLTGAGER